MSQPEVRSHRPVRVRRGVRGFPRRPVRFPARRPRVSLVIVDTGVASALMRRRATEALARQLAGHTIAITIVTDMLQRTRLDRPTPS